MSIFFPLISTNYRVTLQMLVPTISFFFGLKMYSFLYVAEDYGKGSRNSSCVKYKSNNRNDLYGCIKIFVKVTDCKCQVCCDHFGTFFALIKRYDCSVAFYTTNPVVPITSFLSCAPSETVDCVPIHNLECVCFKLCDDSSLFLSVPLNPYELE